MSKDISTMYSKEREKSCGRRGYVGWKAEKETSISPKNYGQFILNRKRRKKQ